MTLLQTELRRATKTQRLTNVYVCGAISLLFTAFAWAGEHSVETPECTARIIKRTSTHFDHLSPSGGSVFFKRPDMVLICDPSFVTYVSLNWDTSGFPSDEWFNLVAKAGNAVTGANVKQLELAAHRCHRAALKQADEQANATLSDATVHVGRSPEMEAV
ncbi:hypothetical protein NLM27_26650 [Bradyrhizobium sp. CCGB12]|uniref:hypothetical protein n=1 Tax=Bradyrhizobium sp. CCGB12 TaxID=2949632 RepID=UPI0020B2C642|nr:hypothetical protein [Bradyrhizobium sp. CCGB12]MCP3392333.1 hypothetical protein [Bradyrhizobium sp. CCGB12]